MSDLFHPQNDRRHIHMVLQVIAEKRHLTHVILTKRPENILCDRIQIIRGENVWLGVTAENQDMANTRIPILLSVRGDHKKFVSVEPMLEMMKLRTYTGYIGLNGSGVGRSLSQVIIGAETGPNRRPCKPEWIRNLQRQCEDVGVPCHVKKNGRDLIGGQSD